LFKRGSPDKEATKCIPAEGLQNGYASPSLVRIPSEASKMTAHDVGFETGMNPK
jgi:hypothetical protein